MFFHECQVLLAAHSWEYACLPALYGLLTTWSRPQPMDILQLFLPIFPDVEVRQCAIDWMAEIGSDELVDYLPQVSICFTYLLIILKYLLNNGYTCRSCSRRSSTRRGPSRPSPSCCSSAPCSRRGWRTRSTGSSRRSVIKM